MVFISESCGLISRSQAETIVCDLVSVLASTYKSRKDLMVVMFPGWAPGHRPAITKREPEKVLTRHGSPIDREESRSFCLRFQACLQGQQVWEKSQPVPIQSRATDPWSPITAMDLDQKERQVQGVKKVSGPPSDSVTQ
jgi:hypothetical protein